MDFGQNFWRCVEYPRGKQLQFGVDPDLNLSCTSKSSGIPDTTPHP